MKGTPVKVTQIPNSIIWVRTVIYPQKGMFIVVSFVDADWPRTKRHIELERAVMGWDEVTHHAPAFATENLALETALMWHKEMVKGVTEHHPYYLRIARDKLIVGGAREGLTNE